MLKQRLETISTTLLLLIFTIVLSHMCSAGYLADFSLLSAIMPLSTAAYVFIGCILQTFGHRKLSIALGVIVFFILCTCLFYSTSTLDYVEFFICMAIVIRKSSRTCNCKGACENPFR